MTTANGVDTVRIAHPMKNRLQPSLVEPVTHFLAQCTPQELRSLLEVVEESKDASFMERWARVNRRLTTLVEQAAPPVDPIN